MGRKAVQIVLLTLALIALWAVLSDKLDKPLIVGFGAAGIVVAVGLSLRMGLIDQESVPFPRSFAFFRFWSWLGGEIFKANVYVVKTVMAPQLDIQPRLTRVPVTTKDDLARTTFANSITLTPGTVTVELEDTGFLVHALTPELTGLGEFREMERRATRAAEGTRS